MAWIGNGSLQALEGLASSGKKYGDGTADANSNTLQALVGEAYQEYRNAGGECVLPLLAVSFQMTTGAMARGDMVLPRLDAVGYGGGKAGVVLPSMTVAASGTVSPIGTVDIVLPSLEVNASGTVPWPASASIRLPRLAGSAAFGWSTTFSLPSLSVAGVGTRQETGTAAVRLPSLTATGVVSVESLPSYGAITLPALTVGVSGVAGITLPLLQVHGYEAGTISSGGIGVGAFEAWAMNVRTKAVSHITNWPFRKIVRWGNLNLGVADDGLYQIGGEDDNGQPIQWEWRTGMSDLERPGIKRFPVVYLDAVIVGDIFVTTTDDKMDVRSYRYEARRGRVLMPHRQQLGMGVRTRNMAFGAKNGPNGAFMELNGLEPEATVTERNV